MKKNVDVKSPKRLEIYTSVVEAIKIRDEDREAMKKGRGFSDETIDKFRFRSVGEENMVLEGKLRETFGDHELVSSGVFIAERNTARLNPMFYNRETTQILIPYLDKEGKVYHLRPHKMGFSGIGSEIYQELNLENNFGEVVITEGEFKAAAGMQYGINCLAVPGISSFSEKKFPSLLALLKGADIKRVVIMFDNETKDDPSIEARYKPMPHDRYDTQFYAYYLASRLEKEGGFETSIATLPDGWKVDGKIDIDGALAQGKTRQDLLTVIYGAVPRNEYLKGLETEAKQIVLRKNQQKYYKAKINKQFNAYWVTKTTAKGSFDIKISNFIMKVVATHETHEGIKREIQFINEFGKRSSAFVVPAEPMASGDAFRTFALSKGDFIWRGSTDDLLTIWESEFLMMEEGRYIIESDHLGWIERKKVWMFGNVAITEEGREIYPDQNGIFWLENEGVKPMPLTIAYGGKGASSDGIPNLSTGPVIDMKDLREKLKDTIGVNEASIMLGWISSVAFMEEVFKAYRSFPFLFVTGRWQSGKSTIAEWAENFFGIEDAGKAISQTTPVAIQRMLAYYASLPVLLDEYRNTKDILYKSGFLRNVYNRQSAGKGVKDDFGMRDAKVRGTLIIAGEETPKDALQSRCITIFVSAANRKVNHFSWFMANRNRFSSHFMDLLKRKKSLLEGFMASLSEWKEYLVKEGVNERTALNYAPVIAGYEVVYGDDANFAEWVTKETKIVQVEHGEEQAIAMFLDDLMAMKTRKLINDDYWAVSGDRVYLYFHGLHNVWSQEFRKMRGDEAFKESSIRAYLKEEAGYLDSNVKWTIKGQAKKCIVFDLNTANPDILALIDSGLAGVGGRAPGDLV